MSIKLTAPQRLEQFLATLQAVHEANAPITAAHLKELSEILSLYRHSDAHLLRQ